MVAQQHISLLVKSLVLGVYILLLSACGGGGSISRDQTDQGNNTTQVYQVALQIAERNSGNSSNQLSSSTPLTVTATVTDSNGNAINDELVTFSFTQTGLAFFEPANGTALTGTDGVATIDITVGEQAGAGKVVATLESGEAAEIGFVSEGGGTLVTDVPATLDLYTSAIQLASSGSEEIELIALVKNAQNVLLEGVTVSFSSNSGELQIIQAISGTDGTARAILTSQNDPENRTFTVSAEVGSLRQEVNIDVVGTEVRINGPASVILNDTAEITIVVADSDGNGIPNKQVQLSSANGNGLSDTNPRTDETGQITVNYTALNSGVDVITASSLGTVGSTNVSVQQDQFSFSTVPSDDIELNTNASLRVTWLREGVPFPNGTVTFSTTRGTLSSTSGTTDANGQISVSINSTNAGKSTVLAQGVDNTGEIVNARADIEFIATQVDNIIIEASPSSIGPDGQKSTITAVLRDPLGNLVKGKTINFTADDVSGGSISPATVVTDSNGLATTVYTSNTVTSEDAIIITATEPDSNIQASTSLTVGDRALFITLGTGNKIESPDEASYLKKFAVFVTDANSNPVEGVNLTVSGTPVKYSDLLSPNAQPGDPYYGVIRAAFYKGYWIPYPSADAFEYWIPVRTIGCANEDVDDDAILDPSEDINGDGNISPGNVVAIDGTVTTDENGQAIVNMRYPKTHAAWVTVKVTVKALVAGSESRVSQLFTLSASVEDVSIESTPPNNNPFGDGQNFVADPNNPGTTIDDGTALTCTNSL